ncbi:hypothetical protein ANN_20775 [Periplaneta americana]|uniref:Uncharacterized protein n=1 Tax=Periplaneta americana TaxID=6978 RepID=A0ABQ8SDJ0_PERAM|nr:hypothetical protein ANN_20775 [Periplaneta americana]
MAGLCGDGNEPPGSLKARGFTSRKLHLSCGVTVAMVTETEMYYNKFVRDRAYLLVFRKEPIRVKMVGSYDSDMSVDINIEELRKIGCKSSVSEKSVLLLLCHNRNQSACLQKIDLYYSN